MTTTTVLSEDTATIVRDDTGRFSWGPVFAGAVIAAGVTFLLVSVGAGFGLALTSPHAASAKTFLTLGAIWFVAAEAFGFAVGGHVTGRLMTPAAHDDEEENFRSDAHGLAVWALAVVFGLSLAAVAALAAPATIGAATPAAYWADRLLEPAAADPQNGLADAKAEAARLLTADAAGADSRPQLARLVSRFAGLPQGEAFERVNDTEAAMQTAAHKTAGYLGIWTALGLLFGAIVAVAATLSARWHDDHDMFGRPRTAL